MSNIKKLLAEIANFKKGKGNNPFQGIIAEINSMKKIKASEALELLDAALDGYLKDQQNQPHFEKFIKDIFQQISVGSPIIKTSLVTKKFTPLLIKFLNHAPQFVPEFVSTLTRARFEYHIRANFEEFESDALAQRYRDEAPMAPQIFQRSFAALLRYSEPHGHFRRFVSLFAKMAKQDLRLGFQGFIYFISQKSEDPAIPITIEEIESAFSYMAELNASVFIDPNHPEINNFCGLSVRDILLSVCRGDEAVVMATFNALQKKHILVPGVVIDIASVLAQNLIFFGQNPSDSKVKKNCELFNNLEFIHGESSLAARNLLVQLLPKLRLNYYDQGLAETLAKITLVYPQAEEIITARISQQLTEAALAGDYSLIKNLFITFDRSRLHYSREFIRELPFRQQMELLETLHGRDFRNVAKSYLIDALVKIKPFPKLFAEINLLNPNIRLRLFQILSNFSAITETVDKVALPEFNDEAKLIEAADFCFVMPQLLTTERTTILFAKKPFLDHLREKFAQCDMSYLVTLFLSSSHSDPRAIEEISDAIIRRGNELEELQIMSLASGTRNHPRVLRIFTELSNQGFQQKIQASVEKYLEEKSKKNIEKFVAEFPHLIKFVANPQDFIKKLPAFYGLILTTLLSPEERDIMRQTVKDYCEKYSSGGLFAIVLQKGFFGAETLRNMSLLGESLTTSPTDPYLDGVINIVDSSLVEQFVIKLATTNSDRSGLGGTRLPDIEFIGDVRLKKFYEAAFIARFLPRALPEAFLVELATNADWIGGVKATMESPSLEYINAASHAFLKLMNARIANPENRYPTNTLYGLKDLLEIVRDLPATRRPINSAVANLAIYKVICDQNVSNDALTFEKFYAALSPKERETLKLFILPQNAFSQMEKFCIGNLAALEVYKSDLEAKIKKAQSEVTRLKDLQDPEREDEKLDEQLKATRMDIMNLQKQVQKIKTFIIDIEELEKKSGKEKEDSLVLLSREVWKIPGLKIVGAEGLNEIIDKLEQGQITQNIQSNWSKFVQNREKFVELGRLCKDPEEYLNIISSALALITMPECPANLAILMQHEVEKRKYDDKDLAAFASAVQTAAMPFLNSAGEVIWTSRNLEEVMKDNDDVLFPYRNFLFLIGRELQESRSTDEEISNYRENLITEGKRVVAKVSAMTAEVPAPEVVHAAAHGAVLAANVSIQRH